VAGVPGVSVPSLQHVTVHAQAGADAGAPGDIGAVIDALQGAPAALGDQRGDAVVGHPHVAKTGAQRAFEQCGVPVVGQSAPAAGERAAQVRRSQLDVAVAPHERAGRGDAHRIDAVLGDAGPGGADADHAQYLGGDGIVGAGRRGGLGQVRHRAFAGGDRHGDLGAADVDAGHAAPGSERLERPPHRNTRWLETELDFIVRIPGW